MAVKIRMKRTGARNDACFRLVAADERSPRDGKNLEILGWYDPGRKDQTFEIKLDRVDYWLGNGAKVSDTAKSVISKARKAPVEKAAPVVEKPVEEAPAPAEAAAVAEEAEEVEAVEEAPATTDA